MLKIVKVDGNLSLIVHLHGRQVAWHFHEAPITLQQCSLCTL